MNGQTETGGMTQADACRRFRRRFPDRDRIFLPVIYAASEQQVVRNLDVARGAGADGVFLVGHGVACRQLLRIVENTLARDPDLFVGVNCLDLPALEVIRILPAGVGGVWADDSALFARARDAGLAIPRVRQATGWDGLLFATVVLKVGPEGTAEPTETAAAAYVDVPTVVGAGFGQRYVQTVRELRRALDRQPLAVAAGISSESVEALLPYVDCVMTTPRTSNGLEQIDAGEAERLAAKIHGP